LTRLEKAVLHLKQEKCLFMLLSVDYLGHTISVKGVQPTKEKVCAITDALPLVMCHNFAHSLDLLTIIAHSYLS